MQIAKLARAMSKHLRGHGEAQVRILCESKLRSAIATHLEACKNTLAADGTMIRTRAYGGFVANNYGYTAMGDMIEITTDSEGFWTFTVARTFAPSRPHGRGENLIVSLLKGRNSQGKILGKYYL